MLRQFLASIPLGVLFLVIAPSAWSAPDTCDKPCINAQTPEDAIECYTWEIATCPLEDRFLSYKYSARGNAYWKIKDYDKAFTDFDKAVAIYPHAQAFMRRGNIYFMQKKHDLALKDLSKAIEITPRYADAYLNRGKMYYYLGDRDAAIRDMRKADEYGAPSAKGLLKQLGVE